MSMDPLWIAALGTLATAAAAVGGFILAKKTIQTMHKQREADLHLRLYNMWHDPLIQDAIRRTKGMDFKTIQNLDDFPERIELIRILNLLETIAIWIERDYLTKELIAATMLNIMVDMVDTYKIYIDHSRRKEPTDLEHLIRLVNELRSLRHPVVPARK